ncbi:MAG: 3D domain-containing protein [Firmicutes bacterium]|nr:3D domain-containing protein [Bacillota bacterium]
MSDKDVNPHPTWRFIVFAVFALVIGALTVKGLVYAMSKQVSIADSNGYFEEFTTYKSTVAQVLSEKNIVLGDFDEVIPKPWECVFDGEQIAVNRAVYVNLMNGNQHDLVLTAKKTVASLLQSLGITAADNTTLNVAFEDEVFEGMSIRVVYSKEEIVTQKEAIPFEVEKKISNSLKEGETRVVSEGKEGLAEKVYKVCYENDIEVGREQIEQQILSKPANKVVEYGAPAAVQALAYNSGTLISRGGELRYKGVITCSASAYCIQGRTASGMASQVGVVAVDPSVIPLGTRLYIESPNGSWTYGNAIAGDTGGAIKGNKIDLFMNTYQEAISFGRQTAKVYILE